MEDVERSARKVIDKLVLEGHTAYYAGGYVRDRIMGHPSDDIDIATTAPVEIVQTLFKKTIPVGVQFGIVIVVMDGHQFEVATFRKEEEYKDGRRPTKIEPATPEEDAVRRDFTINGMFYDPTTGEVIDYIDGKKDIKHRIIRAIGNPKERFMEDRLRKRSRADLHLSITSQLIRPLSSRFSPYFLTSHWMKSSLFAWCLSGQIEKKT